MSDKANPLPRQQRRMKAFCFVIFPGWVVLIELINAWTDANQRRPFNWTNLLICGGMIVWAVMIYFVSSAIFRFVASITSDRERP